MLFVTFLLNTILLHLQCSASAAATLVNVTVDDQFGDPYIHSITYTPSEAWITAPNCSHCPDPSSLSITKVHNRTWHESYFSADSASGAVRPNTPRYASFQFMGNAVYVTCIIPPSTNITNRMKFIIDGFVVGSYPPTSATPGEWQYDIVVYRNTSMSMANHWLLIQSGEEDGPDAIILLDSIMYSTYDDGSADGVSLNRSTSGSKKAPLVPVIGGTVGAVVLVLVCGLIFFLHQRRRRSLSAAVRSTSPWWIRLLHSLNQQSSRTKMPFDSLKTAHAASPYSHTGPSSVHAQIDSRTQSILAWQQSTQQGTRSLNLAPLDASEELSSYYGNSTTTESRRVRTPPPPPRRYIVTNK